MACKIIKEVVAGNGQQFTLKEVMLSHIRETDVFQTWVREKLSHGTSKIRDNKEEISVIRTKIKSTNRLIRYVILPLIVLIISSLIGGPFIMGLM